MSYQLWEIVSSQKPPLDRSNALRSSIVNAQGMFKTIQEHCKAMGPKFYTNRDIVAALQGLDLAKYISLSDDPAIWWNEIEPALNFFLWSKKIEDSVSGGSPIRFWYCYC